MQFLKSQFAQPRGILGRLAGALMARENRRLNQWVIALLDIRPGDTVLEVSFGPGVGIRLAARLAFRGCVFGVDTSQAMLKEATDRNARAIQAGRVRLQQGDVAALPFTDTTFDRVYSVNSVYTWPDRLAGLKELARVVKPGGKIALSLQARGAKTEDEVRAAGEEVAAELESAGFRQMRMRTRPMKPLLAVCVLAER